METETDLAAKFWKALRSDRTVMLGLIGLEDGHTQPMTALLDGDEDAGPIWIFSARDVELVRALRGRRPAVLHFVAKDHGLFASVQGRLEVDTAPAVVDRLWNPFIAAWYEGGKQDPALRLLRFDPDRAQVWLNENSVFSAVKLLLGRDPKQEYADKVADVSLAD